MPVVQIPRSGLLNEASRLLEQVIAAGNLQPEECHFWRTEHGAELDLLVVRGRHRIGFEFKRSSAPTLTPSMRQAAADLKLAALYVVHAGENRFSLGKPIEAVPWTEPTEVVRAAL